jgi:hypothetical protein
MLMRRLGRIPTQNRARCERTVTNLRAKCRRKKRKPHMIHDIIANTLLLTFLSLCGVEVWAFSRLVRIVYSGRFNKPAA